MALYCAALIALLGIALTGAYAVEEYYYTVPFYDMMKSYNDIFTDPWYLFIIKPENEHVHVFAKLFYLADMYFNAGRGLLILVFMFLFMALISLTIAVNLVPKGTAGRFRWVISLTIAGLALFLWVDNYENLLWEKQIHVFTSLVFFALAVAVLRAGEMSLARFGAVVALSFCATLSFGYGLVAAITIFLLAVALRLARRWLIGFGLATLAQLALWRALMMLAVPPYHSYPADSIAHPLAVADYLFRFLRIPVERIAIAVFQPPVAHALATLVALIGLGLAALAGRAFLVRQERQSAPLLGLALILFGLGNAAVTALARSGPGLPAEASRYQFVAILFWVGLVIYHVPQLRRWAGPHPLAMATLCLLCCLSFAWSQARDWNQLVAAGSSMRSLEVPLLNRVTDASVLDRLYWDRPTELFVLDALAKRRLSIFSRPESDWLNRPLADIAAIGTGCTGWVDGAEPAGSSNPYTHLYGWAYRLDQHAPPDAVVIVAEGRIVGLGLLSGNRPDVHDARPELPARGIGWDAAVNQAPPLADYTAYAIGAGPTGRVACPLDKT